MEPTLLMQLVTAFGPMGFVMWLVWRTTNHTIPRLAKSFEDALDRQRVDFKEMIQQQRHDFEKTLAREQKACEIHTETIAESMQTLAESIRSK